MEVTLSSDGLYLRDVISRLNCLRGKGMATMYAWSSKRSYKHGFVWHDLSDNDFIHPAHGHEYVLKGSELLQGSGAASSSISQGTSRATSATSSGSDKSLDFPEPAAGGDSDFPLLRRKKNPWHSFELAEYKVYKAENTAEAAVKVAADASTQTDERRQRRRSRGSGGVPGPEEADPTTELSRDEISPPPSSSSPDTLETLIRADVLAATAVSGDGDPERAAAGAHASGRTRASAMLMHLISCGSLSVKDHGFSLVSQYRSRLPRRRVLEASEQAAAKEECPCPEGRSGFPAVTLEEKEYFSGSLIEMKKKESEGSGEPASLQRSSSFNADRVSKLELAEREEDDDGVRAKCLPRRAARSLVTRKETTGNRGSVSSRSADAGKLPTSGRRDL
ncbi:unnamed protein product [Spirodela intermedia]|uniref:SOSEKI DIX-like domain-containing protein n=1 Tax=Spirodela intermedia TaxID=51605 RepID=A0A7I8IC20_SPIIN|nr:unnamed protein product [Spirodela intermedia]CAA6654904.1 unnamed protein product [Spirodela intermedia]